MNRHNIVKVDEHQLITCIKHSRWGSTRRFRSDQGWKKNDIIYFVVGEELAAKAIIESESFYESASVWTEDKYKFHVDIRFDAYILPEKRKSESVKASILLNDEKSIEKIKANVGNYYRGISKLSSQQIYRIEEEFNTSTTVSNYDEVVNKYFITSFIDRMDFKINSIKTSARVNYYKKEDEVLDYVNTLWFIALVTHDNNLVNSSVLDQNKTDVIKNKFNEIKKIKREKDKNTGKKEIKDIHIEIANIFQSLKGIFELYGSYFESMEPEYLKITNIIDLLKQIITEFDYVENNKEIFDNLTLDWFINRYIDSFRKVKKKVPEGVSMHLSTMIDAIGDGFKFSVNNPLSDDSGVISDIAKLDDKIVLFEIDDFSYTAIRTTVVRLIANKLSIDKIRLNEGKFLNPKKEFKVDKGVNYFLILNTIGYTNEESVEKLLKNVEKINDDSIIISLLSLRDFLKHKDINSSGSFVYNFSQVSSSIVATNINLGTSKNVEKIVMMIGKKNKNNDNFSYLDIEYDDDTINYDLFFDSLVKEGYISNKNKFIFPIENNSEENIIEKTDIASNVINLDISKKIINKENFEDSKIITILSNTQKELLNYIIVSKKKSEYFSTNELIKEFKITKKLDDLNNQANFFFYESALELFHSLGILGFSYVSNISEEDSFYTSELKKWFLEITV